MSEKNVEIVREAMALIRQAGSGEPESRLLELLAPDMTLDMSRRRFNPDIYEGHAGLRRFRAERDDIWEEFLVTPERMIGAGDKVLVIESLEGRGKGSGVEIRARSHSVWTVREGRIVHMATYYDLHDARTAAGLEE